MEAVWDVKQPHVCLQTDLLHGLRFHHHPQCLLLVTSPYDLWRGVWDSWACCGQVYWARLVYR